MKIGEISLLCVLLLIVLFLWSYIHNRARWCKNFTCLIGKTVLITGGNKGLGYQSALEFAKRGARVILACRNQKLGNEAKDRIIESTQNYNIVVKYVDFSSLTTVRSFAKNICETEERLDILVNNVGISFSSGKKTEDGFPEIMQINYGAHVLLIFLLFDILKRSAPCRIINLSSFLAVYAIIFDAEYLNKPPKIFSNQWINCLYQYMTSKLAIILFTKRLAQLLQNEKIYVYSIHPGIVQTGLLEYFSGPVKLLWKLFVNIYAKTVEEGVQTIIYTATETGIEKFTGKHFDNCRLVSTYYNARSKAKQKEWFTKTLDSLGIQRECKQILNWERAYS